MIKKRNHSKKNCNYSNYLLTPLALLAASFMLFSSFISSWWISGIVAYCLCHLYDVLWCAIALWCIGEVWTGYYFFSCGCAFMCLWVAVLRKKAIWNRMLVTYHNSRFHGYRHSPLSHQECFGGVAFFQTLAMIWNIYQSRWVLLTWYTYGIIFHIDTIKVCWCHLVQTWILRPDQFIPF